MEKLYLCLRGGVRGVHLMSIHGLSVEWRLERHSMARINKATTFHRHQNDLQTLPLIGNLSAFK